MNRPSQAPLLRFRRAFELAWSARRRASRAGCRLWRTHEPGGRPRGYATSLVRSLYDRAKCADDRCGSDGGAVAWPCDPGAEDGRSPGGTALPATC